MRTWKTVAVVAVVLLIGLPLAGVLLGTWLKEFLVDLWWFQSLGYAFYFWQRVLYQYLVFAGAAAFFFLIFFFNFRIAARTLGTDRPMPDGAASEGDRPSRARYERFQRWALALYLPLSLLLGVIIALPLASHWERALMFLLAPGTGLEDPVFGLDIRFYLFTLPIAAFAYAEVVVALVLLLLGLLVLYGIEHRVMPTEGPGLRRGARFHLSLVVLGLFLMGVLYLFGDGLMLLYTHAHQPIFYGPGYPEMRVTLPLIGTAILMLLLAGGLSVYLLNSRRGLRPLVGVGVLLLAVLGLRATPFLTDMVQEYVVEPNEFTRQAPFIANNIDATLAAYRLGDVETREYRIREEAWNEITPKMRSSLKNIPIWNDRELLSVYRELQELRPYYRFPAVDVGRFTIDDVYQQVFLSAREIDLDKLRDPIQTWVNRWFKYTHGYGVAMTPASQDAAAPLDWLVQGIPPTTAEGIDIEQAAVYYGIGNYYPAIAPNASRELDYGAQDDVELTDYSGDGGVPLDSLFRRIIFSLYFDEKKILYTTQITDESRMLFRRNIRERIEHLTPSLLLDPDPYITIADGKLYWIQDALTASNWYPYSAPYAGDVEDFEHPFNYLRDSVKIVVDAYNGSVDYYLTDPDDPIATAYARIYPGLLKPFSEMPDALKAHVRYPKSMFDVQMGVYARYHQTEPQTFYNQEDAWEFPVVEWQEEVHPITSYYLMLNLLDEERFEYSLFVPMTPLGKSNMRALAVAGSDGDNYGRLVVYNFPKGTLVYGPAQVNTFIRQDPEISKELTLWNQQGSNARRGRMIVLPVDGVVSYIQGIFLEAADGSHMPQLARIIVSQGRMLAMEESVEESFRSLHELILDTEEDPPVQKLSPPETTPEVTSSDDATGAD